MIERCYKFGPFAFDAQRRLLRKNGSLVALGQRSATLLEMLLAAKGHAVSKAELIEATWQKRAVEESNLAVQIAALRKCLGRFRNGEEWIVTVQRVGYQFVDCDEVENAPALQDHAVKDQSVQDHAAKDQASLAAQVSAGRLTIAVPPFASLNGDAEQDFLSHTLSEDIIAELTRWRLFSVQSHIAPLQPDSAPTNGQVNGNGKARYVVEGSVRRMNGLMRIAVKLIDTESGHHVWAERFDCGTPDISTVQDQLVSRIVGTLVGRAEAAAAERANRRSATTPAAYECVLQGNALPWDDPAARAEATRLFSKAIEIDPGYGLAHALLAAVTVNRWHRELGESEEILDEAYRLARRAVELGNDESTCFAMLGIVCMFRRSFDVAQQHLQRALEINPGNQWNTADMGCVLFHAGQHEAALTYLERAREIDPYLDPPWYWCSVGLTNMLLRRYREAIVAFDRCPVPNYHVAALLAGCHARLADTKQAAALIEECLSLQPALRVSALMRMEPFKNPADAAHLAECLEMAGLPA